MASQLASTLIRFVGWRAARRFEAATRQAAAAQQAKLLEILTKNRDTEYGKAHGFAGIRSLEDYQRAVPVVTYDDLGEQMARVARGERNVFTAEDPVMFARTSGTTGEPKYIPVTPTCQGRDHSDQTRTWIYHAHRDHPGLFRGKVLSLVSPAVEGFTPGGIPYGSTSGHIYKSFPWIIRSTYVLPYDVFEIPDYEVKYYVVMRLGIASDVSFLCTANPSSIVKLCEVASERAEDLLRDLGDGTLNRDLDIPRATRTLIESRLRPDPARAKRLEAARRGRQGKLVPADYWPNLALIGCWKGGTVSSYLEQFPQWFDPDGRRPLPVRDWGYLSSEVRGSIPLSDEGSGGVLTIAADIFEFVEKDQVELHPDDRQAWTFHGVDTVELGKEYYIFVTTTAGLYRYDINDVVQVVGHHHGTPVIVFLRKGRGMTSITGEKVSVNQIIAAFDSAARELSVQVSHFRAEADTTGRRYIFKVEPSQPLAVELHRRLLEALEKCLCQLNLEYAAKRSSLRLKAPVLRVMRSGWYDDQKARLASDGKPLFQAKTVLLASWHEEADGREEPFLEAEVKIDGR